MNITIGVGTYLVLLLIISLLTMGKISISSLQVDHQGNFYTLTDQQAWDKECKVIVKFNYIFPAQKLGCWFMEPIDK